MRYFLIAGEASGDLHAAWLIRALRRADKDAKFQFTGGGQMAEAAGLPPLIHYRQMAFMGVWDVLKNLKTIRHNFRTVKNAIRTYRPDALILVDYPGFNLRMAEWAKKQGFRVYYFISPKIWAWKEKRVEIIRRYVDRMLVILPFETEFYRRHGISVTYVGNPVKEEMEAYRPGTEEEFRRHAGLSSGRPLIALLPGSRVSELKHMLPVMSRLPSRFPEYEFVIAGAPGMPPHMYERFGATDIPVVYNATYDLLYHAKAAVVTSGTATLETALAGTPQITGYKTMALQYYIGKHFIRVPFISLVNLILKRPLIAELLQNDFNETTIIRHLTPLLREGKSKKAVLEGYEELRRLLGPQKASETAAKVITNDLLGRKKG